MSSRKFTKRVGETRRYTIDWANRLSTANDGSPDTIATSVWEVDTGITVVDDTFAGDDATVEISGGTANVIYTLENTITCVTTGSILIEEIYIRVHADPIP